MRKRGKAWSGSAAKRLHALGLLLVLLATPLQAAAQPSEYELKAIFVYKLATYISWPPSAADARRPFVIAILGRDPFGRIIDDVVRGENVNGRRVLVKRVSRAEEALECDVLFVSSSEKSNVARILQEVRDAPVLTVADMDQFAQAGGMINLVNDQRRIRFEVNVSAIDRAGFKAASQLLALARIVDERR